MKEKGGWPRHSPTLHSSSFFCWGLKIVGLVGAHLNRNKDNLEKKLASLLFCPRYHRTTMNLLSWQRSLSKFPSLLKINHRSQSGNGGRDPMLRCWEAWRSLRAFDRLLMVITGATSHFIQGCGNILFISFSHSKML